MELKDLLTLYRRWLWLLIMGLVIGLILGFAASKIQKPVYEASAKVLITRSRQQSAADILPISDQQLVLTYQQLLKTRSVLNDAQSKLAGTIDPANITVDVLTNTQILQIKIQDGDPARAAAIANMLVQILIEQNENLQAGRYAVYEENLSSQVAQVQDQINSLQGQITQINQATVDEQLALVRQQITDLQTEISQLEQEIAKTPNPVKTSDRASVAEKQTQVEQLRSLLYLYQQIETNLTFIGKPVQGGIGRDDPRISSLQATLDLYQQLYLDLLNNLETVKLAHVQSTPTVTLIEDASIPNDPIRPTPLLYTLIAGIVGLFFAASTILLIDYFDDTIRSSFKVRETLGLPVLAEIVQIGKSDNTRNIFPFHNSFGILRMNVNRLLAQNPCKSVLVTSGSLGEGKTTVAINLAGAYAKVGKKVLLLDGDFYRPTLHTHLKLNNRKGLSDILAENLDWREIAQESRGMVVITSGHHPDGSASQFESDQMTELLKQFQQEVDMIIIDGPPLLMVDSQALSIQVGGVLLVVRQANTSIASVRTMLEQLKLMGVNVLGVVLNRVPHGNTYYYGGYGYFPNGHHNEEEEEREEDARKHLN